MMEYLEKVKLANKWAYAYYTLDNPEATDAEYDELLNSIKEIEKETGFIHPTSPTLRRRKKYGIFRKSKVSK